MLYKEHAGMARLLRPLGCLHGCAALRRLYAFACTSAKDAAIAWLRVQDTICAGFGWRWCARVRDLYAGHLAASSLLQQGLPKL